MLIADSQVHVWSANTPERPWRPGTKPHRVVPLDTAQLLKEMDEELTALEQRRNKTAALKQGMMQELLTGRTRLV